MMNDLKLSIVNSLVVTGLVAASMAMPMVAAELAQAPSNHQAPVTAQTADSNTIR